LTFILSSRIFLGLFGILVFSISFTILSHAKRVLILHSSKEMCLIGKELALWAATAARHITATPKKYELVAILWQGEGNCGLWTQQITGLYRL
jgi:hypothetical protein